MINIKTYNITSLDSIRGIAAINVLLYHFYLLSNTESVLYGSGQIWAAGHEAVILFFVLSGFVLSKSIIRSENNFIYLSYIVKRIFRIMPVYYIVMLGAILFYMVVKPQPLSSLTSWFNDQMPSLVSLNMKVLVSTIFFAPSNKLNGVVWSLTYEILISLIYLPSIIYLLKKSLLMVWVLLFVLLCCFCVYTPQHFFITSLFYGIFFIFGVILVYYFEVLRNINRLLVLLLAPISMLLYFNKFIFNDLFTYNENIRDILTGIGSVGFILIACSNIFIIKVLSHKIFLFYGKISYPLYLLHIPIIYIMIYTLLPLLSLVWVKLISFIFISLLAWLVHNYIEKPMVNYGRGLFIK